MKKAMRGLSVLVAALACHSFVPAAAQEAAAAAVADGKGAKAVLRGNDWTADGFADMLTPREKPPCNPEIEKEKCRRLVHARPGARKSIDVTPPAKEDDSPHAAILITFLTGSSQLSDEAYAQLDKVAVAFQDDKLAPFNFHVEGHADPRGSAEGNLALSRARAESVVHYLVARGVDARRLHAVGMGSSKLLNTENPIAEENRRVEFVTDVHND